MGLGIASYPGQFQLLYANMTAVFSVYFRTLKNDDITWKSSLTIGCFVQCKDMSIRDAAASYVTKLITNIQLKGVPIVIRISYKLTFYGKSPPFLVCVWARHRGCSCVGFGYHCQWSKTRAPVQVWGTYRKECQFPLRWYSCPLSVLPLHISFPLPLCFMSPFP